MVLLGSNHPNGEALLHEDRELEHIVIHCKHDHLDLPLDMVVAVPISTAGNSQQERFEWYSLCSYRYSPESNILAPYWYTIERVFRPSKGKNTERMRISVYILKLNILGVSPLCWDQCGENTRYGACRILHRIYNVLPRLPSQQQPSGHLQVNWIMSYLI